jgi:osmotically-inducible protein OsmY
MKPLLLAVIAATLLAACATSGSRSSREAAVDERIEGDVRARISASDPAFKSARIVVVSHRGNVLLAGQVPSEDLRMRAQDAAAAASDVRLVHNELAVGSTGGFMTRAGDGLITTKVKSALVSQKVASAEEISVSTIDGVVYLMGSVPRPQADEAVGVAQTVSGVQKIVRVFEYVE